MPKPANDNARKLARAAVRALPRFLRIHPAFRLATTAYDVYRLYLWAKGQPGQFPGFHIPDGWRHDGGCGSPPPTVMRETYYPGCIKNQGWSTTEVKPTSQYFALLAPMENNADRCQYIASYRRAGATELPTYDPSYPGDGAKPGYIGPVPTPYGNPLPGWMPGLVPELLPITQPAPEPEPMPRRLLPRRPRTFPWWAPGQGSERGPEAPTRPLPPPAPIQVWPPTDTPPAPEHQFARPGRGVKERKYKMSIHAQSILGRGLNVLTEGLDFLDVLYDALPQRYRKRGATPQEKATAIWRHHDEIELDDVVLGWLQNHQGDRFAGEYLGKQVADFNQQLGRSHGITLGPAL